MCVYIYIYVCFYTDLLNKLGGLYLVVFPFFLFVYINCAYIPCTPGRVVTLQLDLANFTVVSQTMSRFVYSMYIIKVCVYYAIHQVTPVFVCWCVCICNICVCMVCVYYAYYQVTHYCAHSHSHSLHVCDKQVVFVWNVKMLLSRKRCGDASKNVVFFETKSAKTCMFLIACSVQGYKRGRYLEAEAFIYQNARVLVGLRITCFLYDWWCLAWCARLLIRVCASCMHTHTHTCNWYPHVCIHTHMCIWLIYIYICIIYMYCWYVHSHTHTHIYVHSYMYVYMYIYVRVCHTYTYMNTCCIYISCKHIEETTQGVFL